MLYTSLSKKGRKTKTRERRQRAKDTSFTFLYCILSRQVGEAMPTEGSGGAIWRSLSSPNANFMIREIFFGLMVPEKLL